LYLEWTHDAVEIEFEEVLRGRVVLLMVGCEGEEGGLIAIDGGLGF
jgi:hypothetical protein